MSKIKVYIFPLLFLVLLFSSCTMEKRIYSSGYHTEWNRRNKTFVKKELGNNNIKQQAEQNKTVSIKQSNTLRSSKRNTTVIDNKTGFAESQSITLEKLKTTNLSRIKKHESNNPETIIKPLTKTNFDNKFEPPILNSNEEPTTNTLALISFISAMLAILYVGILPSLLLGVIAQRQINKNPEKYKNTWMAKVAILVGYIGCGVGILFSLAAAIFGGPVWLILGGLCLIDIIISTILLLIKT